MGKQINCQDCTYRIVMPYYSGKRINCLILGGILGSTKKCLLKDIGDTLLERIKECEREISLLKNK